MSGSRYFSETNSRLTFKRIKDDPLAVDAQALMRVLEAADRENLPEEITTPLWEKFNALPTATELTDNEVSVLRQEIKENSMEYYGVNVDRKGIYFQDGEVGNLYGAGEMLTSLFASVKETVLFSGSVEIWGTMIEEYERLEFQDSELVKAQGAKISWV
jgi:hypothetical protein